MKNNHNSVGIVDSAWSADRMVEAMIDTCQVLLDRLGDDNEITADLALKFRPALSDIISVKIDTLDESLGAFFVDDGVLCLNEADIAQLMKFVLDDLTSELAKDRGTLNADDVKATLHDTVALFMLHELRHRSQGVGDFQTVQLIKEIEGPKQQAKFDIHADRDAALALAVANSESPASDEFFEVYERALYYSVQYFFRIYPATVDRLDKTERVAALLMMLARLHIYRRLGSLRIGQPTDALRISFSRDKSKIAVYITEPSEKLVSAANDCDEIPALVDKIESGALEDALAHAIGLTLELGIN